MRRLPVLAAGLVLLASPVASADEPPACGGVTAVSRTCTFAYQGGQLFYQVQNVRVLVTGILRDDLAAIEVVNVTQQRVVASCEAVTIAAGCGALRNGNGSVAGDVMMCVARGSGAQATTYACSSTPAA